MRVLIIEDQRELAETVAKGLRRAGIAVDLAFDGADGLTKTDVSRYDVVVLDRDLPVIHGDTVCRTLVSRRYPARILMLTAAGTLAAKVDGLLSGADDYLAKPFAFAELTARLHALARRSQPAAPPVLHCGELVLDPGRRTVHRAGRELDLSPKEFAVLQLLMSAQGRVVSAEELLERAWDEAADPFTHTVKVTVSRLRRKLGEPPVIGTTPQAGYRIVAG